MEMNKLAVFFGFGETFWRNTWEILWLICWFPALLIRQTNLRAKSNTPHLVCVVIQNVVLGGGERDPTRAEGGTVWRPVAAAGLPPGPCARLAPSLVLLSPVESYRPPPAAFALGTQEEEEEEEEDVHPTQDHQPPDHIQCGVVSGAQFKKRDRKLPSAALLPYKWCVDKSSGGCGGWDVPGRVISIKKKAVWSSASSACRCFCAARIAVTWVHFGGAGRGVTSQVHLMATHFVTLTLRQAGKVWRSVKTRGSRCFGCRFVGIYARWRECWTASPPQKKNNSPLFVDERRRICCITEFISRLNRVDTDDDASSWGNVSSRRQFLFPLSRATKGPFFYQQPPLNK